MTIELKLESCTPSSLLMVRDGLQGATNTVLLTEPVRDPAPFTAVVPAPSLPEGKQKLCVPGIIIQGGNRQFVEGYGWGRDCYNDEVFTPVWQDGEEVKEVTSWEQLENARTVKTRDITIKEVMQLVQELKKDDLSQESKARRVGMFVGYIVACVETYYGLTCELCGNNPHACTCQRS